MTVWSDSHLSQQSVGWMSSCWVELETVASPVSRLSTGFLSPAFLSFSLQSAVFSPISDLSLSAETMPYYELNVFTRLPFFLLHSSDFLLCLPHTLQKTATLSILNLFSKCFFPSVFVGLMQFGVCYTSGWITTTTHHRQTGITTRQPSLVTASPL